jgi:hypothetical protein
MGLPEHKLTLTRADIESGRVGGYNDEGLYARHGMCIYDAPNILT